VNTNPNQQGRALYTGDRKGLNTSLAREEWRLTKPRAERSRTQEEQEQTGAAYQTATKVPSEALNEQEKLTKVTQKMGYKKKLRTGPHILEARPTEDMLTGGAQGVTRKLRKGGGETYGGASSAPRAGQRPAAGYDQIRNKTRQGRLKKLNWI